LRWFAAAVFSAALGIGAALVAWGGQAWPAVAIGSFAFLVVFSQNRANVVVSSYATVSPAFMVMMAAVVVLVADGSLIGALLIGMLVGVNARHFHPRRFLWIPLNAGINGVALFGAALVYRELPTTEMPVAILTAVPVALTYALLSWTLLAATYVVEGERWQGVLAEARPIVIEVLAFGVVGFLLGLLYLELGPAVLLLIVVPILIAREMFASYMAVKESHDQTVAVLIRALEQKDRYTSGHSERVAKYAQYMGEQFQFTPARMERLRFAALMHDIGKLVVPNHLLNKPGKLTEEEFARIRLHEKVSVQMLSHIDFLRPIAQQTHSDHMRFDPDDLDHPIEPYMVMIADAYDAMTSTRSYRKALPQEVAFQELRDKAGTQFHPDCVEALIRAIESREEKHGAGYEVQDEFDDAPDAGVGSAGLGDLLGAAGEM
jgi:hypothetical protein